jgi:hypothetical protein
MNELQQNTPPGGLVIAMCATKCDLSMNPDTSHAEALAAKAGAMFLTTSAKTNTNVQALFQKVTERVLDYQQRKTSEGRQIPVTLGTTTVEASALDANDNSNYHPQHGKENAAASSPSAYNASAGMSGHGRIGLAPLPTVPEDNSKGIRSPVDGKRQRPGNDDNLDIVDPAKTPSQDSDKNAENVARCDPHNMLMCGGVDGAGDGAGGCVIQ